MILYKYRTHSERTEQILKSKQVWFAKPETLNDPLECSIQEIAEMNIAKCCEREKQEQLAAFIFKYVRTPESKLIWGLPKNQVKKVLTQIGKEKDLKRKYKI